MDFRYLFSLLSPGQLEFIFRSLALMAGSTFSPGWQIFREAIAPWIDVRTLAHSDRPVMEIIDFYYRMQANRDLLLSTLMPKLFLCMAISLVFILVCNKIGQLAARYVVNKRMNNSLTSA